MHKLISIFGVICGYRIETMRCFRKNSGFLVFHLGRTGVLAEDFYKKTALNSLLATTFSPGVGLNYRLLWWCGSKKGPYPKAYGST